jgi:hypothetical protein
MDFKVAVRILGQAVFVRGAAPGEVDVVDLSDKAAKSSWSDINLLSIVRTTSSIDIKASQNLTDRFVNTKNNL